MKVYQIRLLWHKLYSHVFTAEAAEPLNMVGMGASPCYYESYYSTAAAVEPT